MMRRVVRAVSFTSAGHEIRHWRYAENDHAVCGKYVGGASLRPRSNQSEPCVACKRKMVAAEL